MDNIHIPVTLQTEGPFGPGWFGTIGGDQVVYFDLGIGAEYYYNTIDAASRKSVYIAQPMLLHQNNDGRHLVIHKAGNQTFDQFIETRWLEFQTANYIRIGSVHAPLVRQPGMWWSFIRDDVRYYAGEMLKGIRDVHSCGLTLGQQGIDDCMVVNKGGGLQFTRFNLGKTRNQQMEDIELMRLQLVRALSKKADFERAEFPAPGEITIETVYQDESFDTDLYRFITKLSNTDIRARVDPDWILKDSIDWGNEEKEIGYYRFRDFLNDLSQNERFTFCKTFIVPDWKEKILEPQNDLLRAAAQAYICNQLGISIYVQETLSDQEILSYFTDNDARVPLKHIIIPSLCRNVIVHDRDNSSGSHKPPALLVQHCEEVYDFTCSLIRWAITEYLYVTAPDYIAKLRPRNRVSAIKRRDHQISLLTLPYVLDP